MLNLNTVLEVVILVSQLQISISDIAGIFSTNQLCLVSCHLFHSLLQVQIFYYSFFCNAACGHTSCFWCVNKAMHGFRASYCPICRQPYYHFPNICQLLHYLLLKLEPEAYKRREMEVFGEHLKQLNLVCENVKLNSLIVLFMRIDC